MAMLQTMMMLHAGRSPASASGPSGDPSWGTTTDEPANQPVPACHTH